MRRRLVVKLAAAAAATLPYSGQDFEFSYPPELVLLQDFVYSEASVEGPKHVVVLRHRDSEAGDLRHIEINMLQDLTRAKRCEQYEVCRKVDGVVIGTNSLDPEFSKAFESVVTTFKRR
jgi:hypothetical protein